MIEWKFGAFIVLTKINSRLTPVEAREVVKHMSSHRLDQALSPFVQHRNTDWKLTKFAECSVQIIFIKMKK